MWAARVRIMWVWDEGGLSPLPSLSYFAKVLRMISIPTSSKAAAGAEAGALPPPVSCDCATMAPALPAAGRAAASAPAPRLTSTSIVPTIRSTSVTSAP